MTVDPAVIPGLLLLAAQLIVLAVVGFVVARVALRQDDDRVALAQGLVVGLALWGLIVNVVMHAVPGLAGAIVGWGITLALGAGLAWRAPASLRLRGRTLAGFAIGVVALFWAALTSRQLIGIPDATIHMGLAASIRAGGFPPELPWNPGMPAPYHYGLDLLVGLLTPPVWTRLGLRDGIPGRLHLDELRIARDHDARSTRLVAGRAAASAAPAHSGRLDVVARPAMGHPASSCPGRAAVSRTSRLAGGHLLASRGVALGLGIRGAAQSLPAAVRAGIRVGVCRAGARGAGRAPVMALDPDTRGAGRLCRPYLNHTLAGCTCTLDRAGGCGVLDLQTTAQSPCGGDSRRRTGARCLVACCRQWPGHARPDRRGGIWPHIRLD